MDTVFQSGKTKEGLFQALEAFDAVETLDNLFSNQDEVTVKIKRENGKLSGWELTSPMSQLSSGKKQKGKGLKSLEDTLNDNVFMSSMTLESNPIVIVHCNTSEKKEFDGRIKTRWFVIDPYEPYVENGKYGFETIDFSMTEEEYKLSMETRIALFDVNSDIIYPIRKSAFPNLGKMLDCATLYYDACPIGVAMLLAKNFEDQKKMKNVRFLCLNTSRRIKPISTAVSKNYHRFSKINFLQNFLVEISNEGKTYTVENWSVDNYEIVIEIILSGYSCCGKNGFLLHISDIPGWPITVTAFRKIEDNYIYLRRNSIEHRKNRILVAFQSMLRQSWDDFLDFDTYYSNIQRVYNPEQLMKEFEVITGKKRMAKILSRCDFPEEMDGVEFFHLLLKETKIRFTRNSRKWEIMLREKYYEVLKRISVCQSKRKKETGSLETPIEISVDHNSQMILR